MPWCGMICRYGLNLTIAAYTMEITTASKTNYPKVILYDEL